MAADLARVAEARRMASLTLTADARFARGTVGLQYNGEGVVRFRNVKLQPLGLKAVTIRLLPAGGKHAPTARLQPPRSVKADA